ncbi:Vitamin K epoxide reductase complex subunit 1-like protein 1 [Araneus ventricosus]|uniref:vitamin-K-epoxide reductase (warfarin-sensitive) n=1 Tax=Araneus ventricosus TaxID=182803 RepID=A0A4Y2I2E5_ARAVE|nr:Vitamin K epoxide reductase complex subunit 1-like protein 1 [Araneus ventricosus]
MQTRNRSQDIDLKFLQVATTIFCIAGLLLSIYAYHVEVKKEKDENYTAMCDISEHMSCTAAFSSKYGKGFGILEHIVGKESILNQPNSVFGLVFYLIFMPLGEIPNLTVSKIMIGLAVLSNLCSVYLAYILMFILYDFCVVCVTTYAVNFFLLICSLFRYKFHSAKLKAEASKKSS